jgi:hypothetical protein
VVSADAGLTVQTAPSIQTHPASQTVRVGSNVTFSVIADGLPAPTFQWQFNGVAITGATGTNYTRLNVQTNDAGAYSVAITNVVGGLVSSNALLTVNPWAAVQFQSITRLPDGRIHLLISGEPAAGLWIDAASVLSGWNELTNVFNTNGAVEFIDDSATNNSRRFYRARQ